MNRAWLLVLAILLLISMASAQNQYYEAGEINLKIPCIYNNTYCTATTACNITLLDFNEELIANNQPMTNSVAFFNYTTNLSELGEYQVFMACVSSAGNGFFSNRIFITRNGKEPAEGIFKLFIYVLFIVSVLGLLAMAFLNVFELVTASETIYGVLTSWLFIILTLITIYLSNYLLDDYISSLSQFALDVSWWVNGALPVIGLIVSMIYKGFKKKKPLSVQEVSGRMV
ncbi:MAG: hypothetical protein QME12_06640 [Nanoarchaeota archaeon]|nr:hypothetical protein [Nanoarchaeota archaeon]